MGAAALSQSHGAVHFWRRPYDGDRRNTEPHRARAPQADGPVSLIALFIAVAAPAALGNPALEARADALEMEIRCVQCQNEPIAQSTADIAGDMRVLVRERIMAGDS